MTSRTSLLMALMLMTSEITLSTSQLFPFSSMKNFFDQQHSESSQHTTQAPPPVDDYRFLQERGNHPILPPKSPSKIVERTVIVTPKPKFVPQHINKEPKENPNSPKIPSIGVTSEILQKMKEQKNKPKTTTKPTTTTKPPRQMASISQFEQPPKKIKPSKPSLNDFFSHTTVVDTVPSISLTIPMESVKNRTKDGLVDYLTPPKFPSVYENHMRDSTSSKTTSKPKKTTPHDAPVPPMKMNMKKKDNKTGKRDSVIANSENRIKLRPRPIVLKETMDLQESRPSFTKPRRMRPLHPVEEQIAAETHFGLGGHHQSGGERVEFQLHGQNGPDSYKFGYDTGDSKNRHFRYEEKDPNGNVKGHYGYYDKSGKLQVVNYHADKEGFHATTS